MTPTRSPLHPDTEARLTLLVGCFFAIGIIAAIVVNGVLR